MEEIDGTILPGGVLDSLAMAALFGAGAAKRMETNQLFILQFSPFSHNVQKGQARGLPFCGSEFLYAML